MYQGYPATLRCSTVWLHGCEKYHCSRKLWFQHYYQCRPFPSPHLRLLLEVHINGIRSITIRITESKIHISYSENHDWALMLVFYYFDMSPLTTLADIIAKCNIFSISSPFDVTKLQTIVFTSHRLAAFHSQCQYTCIFVVNCSVHTCTKHKNV